MRARPLALVAALAVASLALAGCAQGPVARGTVTAAVDGSLTSLNPGSGYGDTRTNAIVAHLTGSGFGYYDHDDELVRDESFGRAEVIERDPFTVRYTIADSAAWSDGVRVDADDLLLAWAAGSGALNTKGFASAGAIDPATGAFVAGVPEDVVYFDGAGDPGIPATAGTPTRVPGGRAIDVVYRAAFPNWAMALQPSLPAHVLGRSALKAPADAAADAVGDAILARRVSALAPLSRAWNTAGVIGADDAGRAPLPTSGPYRIQRIAADAVTLSANPGYHGSRQPHVATIVLKTVADPQQAVAQLVDGTLDVASPRPDGAVLKSLLDAKGLRVTQGAEGVFAHLVLRAGEAKSGSFADPEIRRAFLETVPRADILKRVIAPVDADAQVLQSFTLTPGTPAYEASVAANGSEDYGPVDDAAIQDAVETLQGTGTPRPTVCVLYDPADPRRATEFQAIRSSAARAGFTVTDCSSADWEARLATPAAWDAALISRDTTRSSPAEVAESYRSTSPENVGGYANPRVDALVDRLARTESAAEQNRILASIDKALWSDSSGLPLYQQVAVAGIGPKLRNVSLSPSADGVFWNAWDWRLAGSAG